MKKIMVTGGSGFIGTAVCLHLVRDLGWTVLNLDKLTYAGVPGSLKEIEDNPLYRLEKADICDKGAVSRLFADFQPDAVMHLAAESHVDRSIAGPAAFIETNIVGTYTMLECAREYWLTLPAEASNSKPQTANRSNFRFHHISTDEVYGSLGAEGSFKETSPYDPHSPYAASKAAGDHLVMAWHHTYGLPVVMTNSSNNYGPYQYPEKLIPLVILKALNEKPIPIYGTGENIRDWLYVEDHARALAMVLEKGRIGETYNIGGRCERTNLEVVKTICDILDELKPLRQRSEAGAQQSDVHSRESELTSDLRSPTSEQTLSSYKDLICFVADRPGHDARYAIDAAKIETELGWKAYENFESGIRRTVQWYIDNEWWWEALPAACFEENG